MKRIFIAIIILISAVVILKQSMKEGFETPVPMKVYQNPTLSYGKEP